MKSSAIKRNYLCLSLCLSLPFLASCQSNSSHSTTSSPSGETSSTSMAKNTVVIALSGEPDTGFDPCYGWGRFGNPLIQSRLFYFNEEMDLEYDLATDYVMSEEGTTWTITLREDAYFTDGTPLTAKDVAFTFMTAKEQGANFDLTVLDSISIEDDYTLSFHLTHPQFAFLYTVAQTGIVPSHSYDSNYGQAPVGSGPFVFRQWDKGQQLILTANEDYYGEVPSLKQVTLLFMNNTATLTAAKQGIVDVALTDPVTASGGSGNNFAQPMTLHQFSSIDNRGISLPVSEEHNAVTSDVAVRQALSYGIDRDLLVTYCLNGYGTAAFTECDGMPWSHPDVSVEFNPDYAISLLEQGGWHLNQEGIREKEGVLAEFTLFYYAGDSVRQALAFSVAQQVLDLGIVIHTQGSSWNEIQQNMSSNPVLLGFGAENPMETYLLYHSSNAGLDYYNSEQYRNQTTDYYLDLAMAQTSSDDAFALLQQVQWDGSTGVSALGELPFLWLVNVDHLFYIADGLSVGTQKLHPHGHDYPLLHNLQEWEWE